ncbi:MAG: SDR family oxidoreductase [Cyanosarcina radialis HA8281-LM2]|nr:SDR family oxidoreductase [Cyanosarcina radialis HA8281-LM2]
MSISLKPLSKQTVVITGASSGIGLVTARMAAQQGAKLVLAARNEDALRQLTEEIRHQGGQATYAVADVGQEEDVNRIAERAIAEFGGFDTWVNDAGVSIFGRCMDVSIPDMKRMFDTNFWGVVYGSRAAVNHFKQRVIGSGALINVGSFLGDRAVAVQSTYSASKHAVHGWTDALRTELEADGLPVSVTLIHPGRIDTPYNEHARNYMPHQPAHRGIIYPPEAVAEAILFAAEHPKRDMYVGFQAKVLAVVGGIAPRLSDKIIEFWAFPSQQSDRPARDSDESGLYHPGYGLHERGTHQGWIRSRSWYVKAEKHPVTAAIAVGSLGAIVWWLMASV